MPDYIDREAANLALAEKGFDWDKAKQALASVPAADVAPVVHGRWLHSGYTDHLEVVKCSECNHEAFAISLYVCDGNYCPNCGAKMGGGVNNETD